MKKINEILKDHNVPNWATFGGMVVLAIWAIFGHFSSQESSKEAIALVALQSFEEKSLNLYSKFAELTDELKENPTNAVRKAPSISAPIRVAFLESQQLEKFLSDPSVIKTYQNSLNELRTSMNNVEKPEDFQPVYKNIQSTLQSRKSVILLAKDAAGL